MNKHQQRTEETRNHIMDAAEASFAEAGYDGTGVAAICQAAGVSKGAFYYHFESKQALFLALIDRWLASMDRQLADLSQEATGTPGRLMAMSHIVGHLLKVPDRQLLIYLEFLNRAVRDPQVWQATIKPYLRYRDYFVALVEAGIAEGSLRPVAPKSAAGLIVALGLGLLIQGFLDPEGTDWQQVTQEGVGILLEGIEAKE